VQQIYADFPEELYARYGPGLQLLVQPAEPASGAADNTAEETA
jgi:hypothetical protein